MTSYAHGYRPGGMGGNNGMSNLGQVWVMLGKEKGVLVGVCVCAKQCFIVTRVIANTITDTCITRRQGGK